MEEATAMQNLQPPRYKVAPAASGVSHPFQFGRGASAPAPAPVDTHEDSDAVISPGGTRSQERSSQVTFCKGGVTHNKKGFAVSFGNMMYIPSLYCV